MSERSFGQQFAQLQWEQTFAAVHAITVHNPLHYVVIVRPTQDILSLTGPVAGAVPGSYLERMEQLVPSNPRRSIAVIAPTDFKPDPGARNDASGRPELNAAQIAIPFLGMMMGLASIGHAVWAFDGQGASLEPGVRGADVLIIDDIMANKLTMKAMEAAARVMRNANIFIHDRTNFALRTLKKVGKSAQMEFA